MRHCSASRAALPEDVRCGLAGTGELKLDQPKGLVRQLSRGRAYRYRSERAHPHGRTRRGLEPGGRPARAAQLEPPDPPPWNRIEPKAHGHWLGKLS